MSSFKEFLLRKKVIIGGGLPPAIEYIAVRDLGEWAFNKAFRKLWAVSDDDFYVYREISNACLGKNKVKKLLRESKK